MGDKNKLSACGGERGREHKVFFFFSFFLMYASCPLSLRLISPGLLARSAVFAWPWSIYMLSAVKWCPHISKFCIVEGGVRTTLNFAFELSGLLFDSGT